MPSTPGIRMSVRIDSYTMSVGEQIERLRSGSSFEHVEAALPRM